LERPAPQHLAPVRVDQKAGSDDARATSTGTAGPLRRGVDVSKSLYALTLVAAILGFLVGFYFIGELFALIAAATSAGIIFAVARPTEDDRS
jgi:hypothetical protein